MRCSITLTHYQAVPSNDHPTMELTYVDSSIDTLYSWEYGVTVHYPPVSELLSASLYVSKRGAY